MPQSMAYYRLVRPFSWRPRFDETLEQGQVAPSMSRSKLCSKGLTIQTGCWMEKMTLDSTVFPAQTWDVSSIDAFIPAECSISITWTIKATGGTCHQDEAFCRRVIAQQSGLPWNLYNLSCSFDMDDIIERGESHQMRDIQKTQRRRSTSWARHRQQQFLSTQT